MTLNQERELLDLLWEYLEQDYTHDDRVVTGRGSKTKTGLIACIADIMSHDPRYFTDLEGA